MDWCSIRGFVDFAGFRCDLKRATGCSPSESALRPCRRSLMPPMSFAMSSIFCSLNEQGRVGTVLYGMKERNQWRVTYYCADISTLCLGAVVAFDATALWVQATLAVIQFEQGDALSQPICPMTDLLTTPFPPPAAYA